MKSKTALVIGATGLVGTELVQQLLEDNRFEKVKIFVRRPSGVHHPKLKEFVIDFDQPGQWWTEVTGDVLFSTLGTTRKSAGSKEMQYKIDHTYQLQFATAAAGHSVHTYVLVSAALADPKSRIFYSRIKGELERDIRILHFQHIHILQPGMLTGNRKERRVFEKMGTVLIRFLNRVGIAKKQKPVPAKVVAQAMIRAAFRKDEKIRVYSLLEVFRLADGTIASHKR